MGKMTRAAWCGVWLLSALIIAASLDNIPDPPAEKSGTTHVRAAGVTGSLQALAGGELRNHARVPGLRVAARWHTLKHVIDTRLPVTEIALVRQAADPSPPAFVRG